MGSGRKVLCQRSVRWGKLYIYSIHIYIYIYIQYIHFYWPVLKLLPDIAIILFLHEGYTYYNLCQNSMTEIHGFLGKCKITSRCIRSEPYVWMCTCNDSVSRDYQSWRHHAILTWQLPYMYPSLKKKRYGTSIKPTCSWPAPGQKILGNSVPEAVFSHIMP